MITMVGVPLLILSGVAVVFVLVQGKAVLQPLFIAVFFSLLIRPFIRFLTTPWGQCCHSNGKCWCRCRRAEAPDGEDLSNGRGSGQVGRRRSGSFDEHADAEPNEKDGEPGEAGGERRHLIGPGSRPHSQRHCCASCTGQSRCPRWFAVCIALCAAIVVVGCAVLMLAHALDSFQQADLVLYEHQATKLRNAFLQYIKTKFGVDGTHAFDRVAADLPVSEVFGGVFLFFVSSITGLFIVLLFIVYMLLDVAETTRDEQAEEPGWYSVARDIEQQMQHYVGIKSLLSFSAGLAVFIILGPILDVRLADVFGLLTFLLNFIPNVGALVAVLLPMPVVLLDPRFSWATIVLAFALPAFVHFLVGSVVEPRLFGDKFKIHPLFLLLSLAFWFAVWGVPGAILSVPLTVATRIIAKKSNHMLADEMVKMMEGSALAFLSTAPKKQQ